VICCVQNGLPARRAEGASPNGAVTERRRQPIFNATLRAGGSFVPPSRDCFAGRRSLRISALRSRLGESPNLPPANGKLSQRQDTKCGLPFSATCTETSRRSRQ